MSPVRVSRALLEKLGAPASSELIEILDSQQRASAEAVMTQCADRFERRLVEEMSKLRVDVAQMGGETHVDMAQVRGEMREGFAAVRGEMATNRFELLRWAFVFWVGQVIGVAGVVGLLLRMMPTR